MLSSALSVTTRGISTVQAPITPYASGRGILRLGAAPAGELERDGRRRDQSAGQAGDDVTGLRAERAAQQVGDEAEPREDEGDHPDGARPNVERAAERPLRQDRQHDEREHGELQRGVQFGLAHAAHEPVEPRLLAEREHDDRSGSRGKHEPAGPRKDAERDDRQRGGFGRAADVARRPPSGHHVRGDRKAMAPAITTEPASAPAAS